jgi:hypothetical protein
MSLVHWLFLGHFEHDGGVVRFAKNPGESVYRPVIRRPIDPAAIQAILREMRGTGVDEVSFPEDWQISQQDGIVICDKYTRNPEAIDFVTRLVERTRCDIHDFSAHGDITLRDWLAAVHRYAGR